MLQVYPHFEEVPSHLNFRSSYGFGHYKAAKSLTKKLAGIQISCFSAHHKKKSKKAAFSPRPLPRPRAKKTGQKKTFASFCPVYS